MREGTAGGGGWGPSGGRVGEASGPATRRGALSAAARSYSQDDVAIRNTLKSIAFASA